ncbi:STAS domain-containing protein [Hydrogenophaga soli]|nr:STAS domain-containing protein [Burkholderiaceae bacterium]
MLKLPAQLTHDHVAPCLRQWRGQWPLGDGPVLVDASALNRFDSSALAVVLDLRRQALAQGRTLELLSPPARLLELAALYGVDELLVSSPA